MRDTYYQSSGNPVQRDRLPATRPTTELAPNAASQSHRMTVTWNALAAAMIVGAAVVLLYRPPGLSWLDPFDLLLTTPIIVAAIVLAVRGQGYRAILHPVTLLAAGVFSVNHRVPWGCQTLLIAATLGLLVYLFGRHTVAILTVPPVTRDRAAATRAAAHEQLVFFASLTGVLVAISLWFSSPLLNIITMTLPVAILFTPSPKELQTERWQIYFRGFCSWCSYQSRDVPGLMQCPVGPSKHRVALLVFAAGLLGIVLVRWNCSPMAHIVEVGAAQHADISQRLDAAEASGFERFRYESVTWLVTFAVVAAFPVVIPTFLALSMTTPVLLAAAAEADMAPVGNETQALIDDIRRSPDLIERDSIYLGRVVEDGSPVLVPREVFREHAHGLGDSGSGKTSLFLCPLIEQLVMSGDCSVIVLDLKADTLELLATLTSAAERARLERGVQMSLKFFSNQPDRATFAFNPMTQPFWSNFDLLTRTDILCGANGLTYGTDYGQGYYSSANAAVLFHTLKMFPQVKTFRELADGIGNVITVAKKRDLHPEIRKAGVHVQEVIKRLATCEPLNVTTSTGHDAAVVEHAIDLTQVFREPQLLYFHLSATLSPSGAPEIARLVNYMLLAASTQTERKHPVFLVIDEFQRMVASNLEYLLQLARSMGVGVILANQSMEDLKRSTVNLIPAIEANCRLRQWFSVSSSEDQQRLIRSSGETVDFIEGVNRSDSRNGGTRYSYSKTERVVNRFSMNDVLLTSDHPFRSFLRISRGAGYSQYGGLPVIVESNYHISADEYQKRRSMPWPTPSGSFVPADQRDAVKPKAPTGPVWTQEVIGDDDQDDQEDISTDNSEVDAFFNQLKQSIGNHPPRRKGKQ